METDHRPAIVQLIEHLGGFAAASQALGGRPVYQEIQRWAARGWASPMHIMSLKPLLPKGMTVDDLFADRMQAKSAAHQT